MTISYQVPSSKGSSNRSPVIMCRQNNTVTAEIGLKGQIGTHKPGIDYQIYSGPSFCIGAASTAAVKGLEDIVDSNLRQVAKHSIPTVCQTPTSTGSCNLPITI